MADELVTTTLRGGENDDSPWLLADDQCEKARNVEFFLSSCGERRLGCGPLDLTGSTLATQTIGVHISQWLPANDVLVPEFFAVAATPGASVVVSARTAGVWADLTTTDAPTNSNPAVYKWQTVALNATLFIAYVSGANRLHAKDPGGTNVRRVGIAAPTAAPTGADSGGGGAYPATVRYARVRLVTQVAGVTTIRSEPSLVLTATPDGAHASYTYTKPATPAGETPTHWEIELSADNVNFYRISTIAIGTTTYVDTANPNTYATTGVLSETIGNYDLLPAAQFLVVDSDRLIGLGHMTDASQQSKVFWTPVSSDPGVGNAERLPLNVNNTVSLDNYDGGPITGGASTVSGVWYAFKWSGIYQAIRTNDASNAYNIVRLTATIGAIPYSVVRGVDESGAPCIYFLDPSLGPCRVGQSGVQQIYGIQKKTWKRVNLQATSKVACGAYFADKQQVRFAFAVDGNQRPNYGLTIQVNELRPRDNFSVWRGLSVWSGRITEAVCMEILTELVNLGGFDQVSHRPFIGLTTPDFFQRCDTLSTDAGVSYTATIRTKPLVGLVALLRKFGVMNTAIMATTNTGTNVVVRLIRDFDDTDTGYVHAVTSSLSAGAENPAALFVINELDDLVLSELHTIQIEVSDV